MYNDSPPKVASEQEMYNSDPPLNTTYDHLASQPNDTITSNDASVQKGHTKGVSFFDKSTGIWLVHSVPLFPPKDNYEYPLTGTLYAQTMLCMTFKYSELDKIGTQLYFNYPNSYSSYLPPDIGHDNPNLSKVINGKRQSGTPTSSVIALKTAANYEFKSFAKTNEFNNDLYDGLIAPKLEVGLTAETWIRGSAVPLNCNAKYYTVDAQGIQMNSDVFFTSSSDHAKIARSRNGGYPYVCIGDINRMTTQYVRGGGSQCIKSTNLWNVFNIMVDATTCPAKTFDFL